MASSLIEEHPRKPKTRKFYVVTFDHRVRTAPGWRLENLELLEGGRRGLGPRVGQRGFVEFPEPPRFLIDRSLGRAPRLGDISRLLGRVRSDEERSGDIGP
jgi:hypothetical protein